jgi:DNA-binding NtrC family response regulator
MAPFRIPHVSAVEHRDRLMASFLNSQFTKSDASCDDNSQTASCGTRDCPRPDFCTSQTLHNLYDLRGNIVKALELALICSGMPGFFRTAAGELSKQFRLMESFTLAETAQLIMMHQPQLVIIDGRNVTDSQTSRLQAALNAGTSCRFVVIMRHGAALPFAMPPQLAARIQIAPMVFGETHPDRALLNALQQEFPVPDESACPTAQDGDTSDVDRVAPTAAIRTTGNDLSGSTQHQNATNRPATCSLEETSSHADSDKATSLPVDEAQSMADRFRTRTPDLRQMLRRLAVAAKHNVTLLLIGETGCGKTHLAGLIHEMSSRSDQPFVHVACGALPGELIESELFGHVKGAFTSAHADKDGKFVAAGSGTILLDEIDVLTPDQQVKLLRVIETGQFEPVGSNTTRHVQARIIAASNMQLQPLVQQGRFRPDLYYRLNTLSFTIAPLRSRLPDIEPLARFFVHRHAQQHDIEVVEITQEFIDCLLSYPWPGNVREIENAVRSAVIYSVDGKMTADTLPMHVVSGHAGPANDPSTAAFFAVRDGDSLGQRIELTEKDIIEQALLNNNFSRTNTARHLGISRVTLYNKMRKYGIVPEK